MGLFFFIFFPLALTWGLFLTLNTFGNQRHWTHMSVWFKHRVDYYKKRVLLMQTKNLHLYHLRTSLTLISWFCENVVDRNHNIRTRLDIYIPHGNTYIFVNWISKSISILKNQRQVFLVWDSNMTILNGVEKFELS